MAIYFRPLYTQPHATVKLYRNPVTFLLTSAVQSPYYSPHTTALANTHDPYLHTPEGDQPLRWPPT